MRLQKFLARAGVASRRASERLITGGRVRVDGVVVTTLGTKIDPAAQRVEVDGKRIKLPTARWVALNKPPGTLCSRGDPDGRPTVYDLLPAEWQSLFHVGRLDYMSEGLLLLTNDGDLANDLIHPRARLSRRYRVDLVGPVAGDLPAALMGGVRLEDGLAVASTSSWIVSPDHATPVLELTLLEGRNREVRRMLAAFDVKIRCLCRVSFGPLELGDLERGEARELTKGQVATLTEVAGEAGGTAN